MQSKLEEIEADLTVINENSERLKKTQAELSELQLVLEKAGAFFNEARQSAHGTTSGDSGAASVDAPLLDDVPVRSHQPASAWPVLGMIKLTFWSAGSYEGHQAWLHGRHHRD